MVPVRQELCLFTQRALTKHLQPLQLLCMALRTNSWSAAWWRWQTSEQMATIHRQVQQHTRPGGATMKAQSMGRFPLKAEAFLEQKGREGEWNIYSHLAPHPKNGGLQWHWQCFLPKAGEVEWNGLLSYSSNPFPKYFKTKKLASVHQIMSVDPDALD